MTDLHQSLLNAEFSFLKVVAEKWGLPLSAANARQGLNFLVDALLDPETLSDLEKILSREEKEALASLKVGEAVVSAEGLYGARKLCIPMEELR